MNSEQQKLPGGLLIVFEGLDGAGKTTQIDLAAEQLKTAGWPVKTSHNLGGTPIGDALRKVMLSNLDRPAEADLYISAAIQAALVLDIKHSRAAGQIILLDRSPLSLAAYQIYGSGVDAQLAWPYVDKGIELLAPDMVLFYEGKPADLLERAGGKTGTDYFESKPLGYFEKVGQGYKKALSRYDLPVTVFDAAQPIESVNSATMAAIRRIIDDKLKLL